MANPIAILNEANELAYLAGIFNWQMLDGSYTNPNQTTVSFHVIDTSQAPIEQYISGAINTFNLIAGNSATDPNKGLFNTQLTSNALRENITRKYTLNRVPFANYDQPVDLGTGSQRISFSVLFVGTMYQTAMHNVVQSLFDNSSSGLGVLNHPFYGSIQNVLPIEFNIVYNYEMLNCVICEIIFLTSDITHLNPSSLQAQTLVSEISQWYIGIQNAILSIGGTISAAKSLSSNFAAIL